MNNQTMIVFKKEFREMMRDKRVRSSAILGPFIMVFVLMTIMGTALSTVTGKHTIKVHVVNSRDDDPLVRAMKSGKPISLTLGRKAKPGDDADTFEIVNVGSVEEGKKLLAKGKASVIIKLPDTRPTPSAAATYELYFDGKAERSMIARRDVEQQIQGLNAESLMNLFVAKNISTSEAVPYLVKTEDTKKDQGANEILLSMIPYLVVFLAFVGGVSAASDLVAGEKERNTLETLLITPVPRTRIVIGKFLSLAGICLLSSCSGLAGILAASSGLLPGTHDMFKNGSGVGVGAIGAILLVMIPTVALFAAVLIAVSSYAKNTREAQTYLSIGSIAVAMPTVMSQFLGFTEFGSSRAINFVPILNASSAVRAALTGTLDATTLLLTTGVSSAIALVGILIAVRLCNREEVLLRV